MSKQTATRPEIEPEVELTRALESPMHRFMSAIYRLRLAASVTEGVARQHEYHQHADFVMQEATNDLEKVHKDLRVWYLAHEHTPKAKEVQS